MKKRYIQPRLAICPVAQELPIATSITVSDGTDYTIDDSEEILVKEQFWNDDIFE